MSDVAVVSIGYYHYTVEEDFLPTLLTAAAQGKIKTVEKKHSDGIYRVVIGKSIDISAERLEVITSKEAELAELKERLKKLENS